MPYSVDTSVFITAWRDHYWPDIFAPLWTLVDQAIDDGLLRVVKPVHDELAAKDDEIKAWAKLHPELVVPLDGDIQLASANVLATHPKLLTQGGKRSRADPFVIGLAEARGYDVVTYEQWSNSSAKPHIPNVCADRGVRCLSFRDLIDDLGWRL